MMTFENIPLAPYTTFHIGGVARKLFQVSSEQELADALAVAHAEGLPVFILGAGSNTLVCDAGFDGVVIQLVSRGMFWKSSGDGTVTVEVEAGVPFDEVVLEACRKNLGGIEALSGIPGLAGGALVQNIGAYGQEIADCFVSARVMHRDTLETAEFDRAAMSFAYRHTALKTAGNPWVVVSLKLSLTPYDSETASARCAAHGFQRMAFQKPMTALALRELVLATRRSKGMLYDALDFNTHSVGSFFVNPVVSETDAQRHQAANILKNQKPMPVYPVGNGIKLSAAWLIEQSDISKGFIYRGAALSRYHCLAIVNRENASCCDVLGLAQLVRRAVFKHFRIALEPEVVYLGVCGIEPLPLPACN